jgi:alcohol dehydrogenase
MVYHGSGDKRWGSKADPGVEDPNDAIVKIDTTTICGAELHILKGLEERAARRGMFVKRN